MKRCFILTVVPQTIRFEQSDELEDMTTPEQTFQWLVEHDFPMKFAQTMRDGKFNGASTLDLFGCASTVKEAGEMFKEFELSMVSLLMIWGNARAHGGCGRQPKQQEHGARERHGSRGQQRRSPGARRRAARRDQPG